MEIDVDFDVYKTLTFLRHSEADSYNNVIRRLLKLADVETPHEQSEDQIVGPTNTLLNALKGDMNVKDGAWIGNVFFPNGTKFRATYKGKTYTAKIENEAWLGEDGKQRKSPSDAASAISGTNVNGWRFWFGIRPNDDDWLRLDEFRK